MFADDDSVMAITANRDTMYHCIGSMGGKVFGNRAVEDCLLWSGAAEQGFVVRDATPTHRILATGIVLVGGVQRFDSLAQVISARLGPPVNCPDSASGRGDAGRFVRWLRWSGGGITAQARRGSYDSTEHWLVRRPDSTVEAQMARADVMCGVWLGASGPE